MKYRLIFLKDCNEFCTKDKPDPLKPRIRREPATSLSRYY